MSTDPSSEPISGSGWHGGYRPLVAVVAYHLGGDRVARWPDGGYGVPAPYVEALRRAGARTAIVAPGEPGTGEEVLEPYDGLVLVGGGDVDPRRYGAEEGSDHVYGVEPDRDAFEIELVLAAERLGVPTLCICRGMQILNVAHGGTLHQHLPDRPELLEHGVPLEGGETLHAVEPVAGSFLAAVTEAGEITCSSHHHQGVDRVGDGLVESGRSPDGLVEAIELDVGQGRVDDPTTAPWVVGVQWHPEDTAATDPAQRSLFDAVVLLARLRGTQAKAGERAGRNREYRIADPDPSWPERFEHEAARIVGALPTDLIARIDHVGSTSVPGLAAKPIVDIQLSVRSMSPREPYVEPMVELGYRWVLDPWDVDHEFFSRDVVGERAFHVHVCRSGSRWEARHLAFRDRLRDNADEAEAYAALKGELAEAHPNDTLSYTNAKSAFITEVTQRALDSSPAR